MAKIKLRKASADDPIFSRGPSTFVPVSKPAAENPPNKERFGIVSRHKGAAYSQKWATVSFAYFRTPSGRPPGVD